MGGPCDDVATRWFELCDTSKSGQLYLTFALQAQLRLEAAAGVDTAATRDKLLAVKPGTMIGQDAFLDCVNEVVQSSGKEAELSAELDAMSADVEELGVPPAETGNAVEDMHAYRQYHGLDKAMGYLLQCLIVEEPGDPVQGLIAKMEEMPKLAKLRKELPDKPYWGNMKTSA